MKRKILTTILIFLNLNYRVFAAEIIINEILPNPEGKDSGAEWLELKNIGTGAVELRDWTIVQNNKTTLIQEQKFAPGEITIIKLKNLINKPNLVRLLDPSNKIADEIQYNDAPEGKSFARVTIDGKAIFQWAKPSPRSQNPQFKIITAQPYDKAKSDYFKIKSNNEIKKIYYSTIPSGLINLLSQTPEIELTVGEKGQNYQLIKIRLPPADPPQKKQSNETALLLAAISLALLGLLLLLRNCLRNKSGNLRPG